MDYILSTDNITKRYGKQYAADSISIHIPQGAIYGLIGRNGAGKTTLLKMIGGLATPTSGSFSFFGKTGKEANPYMSRIGLLIEAPGLYPNMSAYKNLKVKCLAVGINKKGYIEDLLETVGLADTGNKPVKKFSLGMKQRLGIALALVGEPDFMILDEPINGLDPQGIVEVREIISKLNTERNITFIISSHILEELAKISTNYGIIHNGKLLQELTKDELLEKCSEHIELRTDNTSKACTVLDEIGITKYKVVSSDTIQIFERLTESGEITVALAQNGVKTLGIVVKNEALEDYFINLTGGAANV